MKLMDYSKFQQILNENIFERSKVVLLEKVAQYPHRYVGLFRPTKPKAKIMQNLLQSHEIRFGDALEKIVEEYLLILGCEILPKHFQMNNGEDLKIDLCFRYKGKIYFIEQKVRDDHDSTKKRGQIENFEKKLNAMLKMYSEQNLVGIFYFVDFALTKNHNYYQEQLEKMQNDYKVELQILYGKELFEYLQVPYVWNEIVSYLEIWRKNIPEIPEINFDLEAEQTFEEIKNMEPGVFRKLFSNKQVFEEILLTLFPEKRTLRLLLQHFQKEEKHIYQTLAEMLMAKIS